jgi:DNA-binding transcriptional LysR family regulator
MLAGRGLRDPIRQGDAFAQGKRLGQPIAAVTRSVARNDAVGQLKICRVHAITFARPSVYGKDGFIQFSITKRYSQLVNLLQLRYFVSIAEEGSFTRAAERLLVAQPSLSQHIKSLEHELGGALLERIPKGVRLTAAGKEFLPEARAAVTHADRAKRNARSVFGLEGGELEVATVTSVAFGVLPPAFERWHANHPSTRIALREYTHRQALDDAVRAGVGDIAVGPRPPLWKGPLVALGWEEFVVVLPRSDPLAKSKRAISLEELADRDWVLYGPDHGLTQLIQTACARVGFVPRSVAQTGQVAAAAHLAACSLGVTIVPSNVLPRGLDAGVRSLKSPLVRQLVAFTRRSWSPLAEVFLEALVALPWDQRPHSATVVD